MEIQKYLIFYSKASMFCISHGKKNQKKCISSLGEHLFVIDLNH